MFRGFQDFILESGTIYVCVSNCEIIHIYPLTLEWDSVSVKCLSVCTDTTSLHVVQKLFIIVFGENWIGSALKDYMAMIILSSLTRVRCTAEVNPSIFARCKFAVHPYLDSVGNNAIWCRNDEVWYKIFFLMVSQVACVLFTGHKAITIFM